MSIRNAKTTPPAEAAPAPSTTPESLGWQLRAALPPMRLHSVTLCDHQGDVLWLSEGALGPDEHGFVAEAIAALKTDNSLAHVESDLQDGRYGVFLAVRSPQSEIVALVMILADSKGLGSKVASRILTQQVRLILQKIAIFLRPQSAVAVVPPSNAGASGIHALPIAPTANAVTAQAPATHAQSNTKAASAVATSAPAKPAASKPATVPAQPDRSPTLPLATSIPTAAAAPAHLQSNARVAPQNRAPVDAPVDFGGATAVLSPLAVDDILSFELVDDDDSGIAPAVPVQADPALALSPTAAGLDGRFDIGDLALEDDSAVVSARAPAVEPLNVARPANPPVLSAPAPAPTPASKEPAITEFDDGFTINELSIADTQPVKKLAKPTPPAALVPTKDVPVLNAAPSQPERAAITSGMTGSTTGPHVAHTSGKHASLGSLESITGEYKPAALMAAAMAQQVAAASTSAPAPAPIAPAVDPRRANTVPKLNTYVDPAFKDLALSVQLLSKLRPGGRTKRYEVLLRSKSNPTAIVAADEIMRSWDQRADLDGFVVSQLLTWLAEHPQANEREPLTFSINLSARALHDERFPEFVGMWLRKSGMAANTLGFELSESLCAQNKAQAERFVAACEKLGCFIVLDDFTMDSRTIELLRSPALKLIKIESKLTNDAMKDKLSQALVIAISQAAKVLGVHCAAKKIESQMVRRWVTAIGFDFAQGTLFEGPQHIDELLTPRADKPPA